MAKKKANALESLLQVLAATLIQELPELAGKGIDAIFHKNKAKIKDAAVPVKPSTPVVAKGPDCPPGYVSDGHGGCMKDPGLKVESGL
jgi:hypothetical protein